MPGKVNLRSLVWQDIPLPFKATLFTHLVLKNMISRLKNDLSPTLPLEGREMLDHNIYHISLKIK